jgi:hypothetical protein
MDLGRKYVSRIFVYCSTFFAVYLFFFAIILLKFFGFLTFNLSVIMYMYVLFDVAFVMTIILCMLYFGAVVNA